MARHTYARMSALALVSVSLAACGSGGGSGGGAGGSEPSPSVSSESAEPSPSPTVDPAVYGKALTTTLAPVDRALRAVDRAPEGKGLAKALGAAATAATSAADSLDTVPTPDDAATGNNDLAMALRDLSGDLTDAAPDNTRCATSPRVELGGGAGPGAVREATDSLTALGYPARLKLPRTEKPRHRRLGNGRLVKDSGRSGLGKLTIDNGTDSDAVIAMTRGKKSVFTVYVRKHDRATVRSVSNGSYTVYFTTGTDWNAAKKSFTRDCSFQKFDDKAVFRTKQVSGGTQYDVLTFSLAKSILGNATTSEIPEDQFPS